MLDMVSYENKPVWFIDGADTGLGAALAEAVLAAGQPVALAARDPQRLLPLLGRYPRGGLALALDVTDAAAIDAAVTVAMAHFGRIDVLVASAGGRCSGAVEERDEPSTRALFDANVFGPINLARRVLPGMRARRSGHVVMLAGATLPTPAGEGFGHAARAALEALAEALFHEVEPLGIGVTLVDAGADKGDASSSQASGAAIADYAGLAARRVRADGFEIDAKRAAHAIIEAVATRGPLRLVLGRAAQQRAYDRLRILKVGFDAWAALGASADATQPASDGAQPARRRRAGGARQPA